MNSTCIKSPFKLALAGKLVFQCLFLCCLALSDFAFPGKIQASENIRTPYYTYVLLGAPSTGKSSFANLYLNFVREKTEGKKFNAPLTAAWQYDRPLHKKSLSEDFESGSYLRVRLGNIQTPEQEFSITHTEGFDGFLYPFDRISVLDTPGFSVENAGESALILGRALDTLNVSDPVKLAQGILFLAVSMADLNALYQEDSGQSFSKKFVAQINALKTALQCFPEKYSSHFSVVVSPDFDNLGGKGADTNLEILQNTLSGVSPLRSKLSKLLATQLNIRMSPDKLYILDTGRALDELLKPGLRHQSDANREVLGSLLGRQYGHRAEAVLWQSGGKKTGSKSLSSGIIPLVEQAAEIEEFTRLADTTFQQLKQSSDSMQEALIESRKFNLTKRPAHAVLKKIAPTMAPNPDLFLNASFKNEQFLTTFEVLSYHFGLNEDGKFTVKHSGKSAEKFSLSDTSAVPVPRVQHSFESSEEGVDSKYMTRFEYTAFPEIILEHQKANLGNLDSFPDLFSDKAMRFHERGRVRELMKKGRQVSLPVLTDGFTLERGANLEANLADSEEVTGKFGHMKKCEKLLSDSHLSSLKCQKYLENLGLKISDLSEMTEKYIETLTKGIGEGVDQDACYCLCYFRASSKAPLDLRGVQLKADTMHSRIRSLTSGIQRFESDFEKESGKILPRLESVKLQASEEDFSGLLSLLSPALRNSLLDLQAAFEKGEIISYLKEGEIRYVSSHPEHLVAVYNLSLVPRYFAANTSDKKVKKYLNPEDEGYSQAIFNLNDAAEDLPGRDKARRELNLLVFGPKGSGKSTFVNFLNHVAATIDARRMEEILDTYGLSEGTGDGISELWLNKDSLRGTWVDHYYSQEIEPSPLRARLSTIVPGSKQPDAQRVPVYSSKSKLRSGIFEGQDGTQMKGNVIDTWESQAPFIEPLHRLNILDSSGMRVPRAKNVVVESGVTNDHVLPVLSAFESAGHDALDALCLVIDGSMIQSKNILALDPQHGEDSETIEYLKFLKDEIDQVLNTQRKLNLPLHVIFTHARELFFEGLEGEDLENTLEKLRLFIERILGRSISNKDIHIYAMDFSGLWNRDIEKSRWNLDLKKNSFEALRFLNKVFENRESGISISLAEFIDMIKENSRFKASHVRLFVDEGIPVNIKGFRLADNLRLESSSYHNFAADVQPILIEGQTIAEKINSLLAEELLIVNNKQENLPYLVGVIVKGKHPDIRIANAEVFPLHHEYIPELTKKFPWIEDDSGVTNLRYKGTDERMLALRGIFARYQAERIRKFSEYFDPGDKDSWLLFVQMGDDKGCFRATCHSYNKEHYFYSYGIKTESITGPLLDSIMQIFFLEDENYLTGILRNQFPPKNTGNLSAHPFTEKGLKFNLKKIDGLALVEGYKVGHLANAGLGVGYAIGYTIGGAFVVAGAILGAQQEMKKY